MRKLAIFSVFQITAVLQKRSYYVLYPQWRISMDKAKQQELIRLWCQLRKARGPAAEEIRIRILEKFGERKDADLAA